MGTREQPSDPPRTEYGYLAVSVAALTTALLLCAGTYEGFVTVGTGVFGILASATVVGGIGWIVRSGDTRRRRDLTAADKRLRAGQADVRGQLAELTSAVERLRVTRQAGVDPEELREQVERMVIEELGTRESVHSQGYAEGYVDGIDRRRGDDEPSPN